MTSGSTVRFPTWLIRLNLALCDPRVLETPPGKMSKLGLIACCWTSPAVKFDWFVELRRVQRVRQRERMVAQGRTGAL